MGKATKAEANYRDGSTSKRCALCTMFRPPHGCTSVEGVIGAHKLCDYFKRKPMAKASNAKDTAPAKPSDDWEVRSALDTLIRAEEIEADAALMAKVRKLAQSKMDDMSEIATGEDEPDKDNRDVGRLVKGGKINDRQAAKLQKSA